jgi:hypothetical protein
VVTQFGQVSHLLAALRIAPKSNRFRLSYKMWVIDRA